MSVAAAPSSTPTSSTKMKNGNDMSSSSSNNLSKKQQQNQVAASSPRSSAPKSSTTKIDTGAVKKQTASVNFNSQSSLAKLEATLSMLEGKATTTNKRFDNDNDAEGEDPASF